MRTSALRMISRGWRRHTSASGARSTAPSSTMRRNVGVSRMPRRIHRPSATSTMLSRNGMRQPQAMNCIAGDGAERQHREIGQEQPGRHAELRPGGDEAAMLVAARPLHRQQHRAAPFAADADALQEAQHGQQDRAPDADAGVAGHQCHQEGGNAHQHQRRDQRRLAADAVAEMAEDRRPDRAGDEADRIDQERLQRADQRIGFREIELREHQAGDGAVEEEVVPLDRGADRAGEHGATQLRAMVGVAPGGVRRAGRGACL